MSHPTVWLPLWSSRADRRLTYLVNLDMHVGSFVDNLRNQDMLVIIHERVVRGHDVGQPWVPTDGCSRMSTPNEVLIMLDRGRPWTFICPCASSPWAFHLGGQSRPFNPDPALLPPPPDPTHLTHPTHPNPHGRQTGRWLTSTKIGYRAC